MNSKETYIRLVEDSFVENFKFWNNALSLLNESLKEHDCYYEYNYDEFCKALISELRVELDTYNTISDNSIKKIVQTIIYNTISTHNYHLN